MSKIAITTDSNSGILIDEGKSKDIFVLPMPFLVNGEMYFEGVNLSQEQFYALLDSDASVSTSQPSRGELSEFWNQILKDYDEIVHLPMSSGLSQSCAAAQTLAKEYDGKVRVVDNRRISVTLKQSVYDAVAERGLDYYDATCPFVSKIHRIVAKHSREGAAVLIAGDGDHPEVAGICGHCCGRRSRRQGDGTVQPLRRLPAGDAGILRPGLPDSYGERKRRH